MIGLLHGQVEHRVGSQLLNMLESRVELRPVATGNHKPHIELVLAQIIVVYPRHCVYQLCGVLDIVIWHCDSHQGTGTCDIGCEYRAKTADGTGFLQLLQALKHGLFGAAKLLRNARKGMAVEREIALDTIEQFAVLLRELDHSPILPARLLKNIPLGFAAGSTCNNLASAVE